MENGRRTPQDALKKPSIENRKPILPQSGVIFERSDVQGADINMQMPALMDSFDVQHRLIHDIH